MQTQFKISPPYMMHNIDDPACWRPGQIELREGWPKLWFNQTTSEFPQLPLLPLQAMVCATHSSQTPSNSLIFEFKWISLLITKTKLKEPCQPTLCTPCAFMNKLAYSLFLAFFLILVNNYFHRDPMLSKWLNNAIWLDEWNHAVPCKVLRISFQKNHQ